MSMQQPRWLDRGVPGVPWGYTCLAWHGAVVIAYHPRNVDPAREWSGTVAVGRGDRP